MLVLAAAALGANHLGMFSKAEDLPEGIEQVVIDQGTEIIFQQSCPVCKKVFHPERDISVRHWIGMSREDLMDALAAGGTQGAVIAFGSELVIIQLLPERCPGCQWPQRGYIGLVEGNKIAVFCEDGSLVETLGDAPGAWLEALEERIPFSSSDECQDLLINLTS